MSDQKSDQASNQRRQNEHILVPTVHDRAFENCTDSVYAALETIDETIKQIEERPTDLDLPKEFWTARRDAVQRAYNALLGQVWIEHYRSHAESPRDALERAEGEGRLIHAWASSLPVQEVTDPAIEIGSPPLLSVDEALRIYAREPERVYVTLKPEEM